MFKSITDGTLTEKQVIESIKTFLEKDPKKEYSLVIGADSQERFNGENKKHIHLVTTVIVHRKGYGGRYFWQTKNVPNIHTLRDKIYAEIYAALAFATDFVPKFKKALNGSSPKYNLEIHVDVGEHGATREMIKEVVGIVTGNGFVAKTKPEAYGATYIADKHT